MVKKQMKYVRKIKRRMLSFVLVVALVTAGLNQDMMPQSIYATQKKEETGEKKIKP